MRWGSVLVVLSFLTNVALTCTNTTECIDRVPKPIMPVKKQGYTKQPDGRGTIDILWTCALTLFLCSWSTMCLHLPAQNDKFYEIWWRKLWLAMLAILGPELVFGAALNQYISARNSVRDFKAAGRDWSLQQAWFADAGGFILKTTDYPAIPLDAKQILYLIEHNHIDPPRVTRRQISDRNKVDAILRMITLWQIIWFSINMALRALEGLHITTLEISTLAFILCSTLSALIWFKKPVDIELPELIESKSTMATILRSAPVDDKQGAHFRYTPLDFASQEEWHMSKIWAHWVHILHRIPGFAHFGLDVRTCPVQRMPMTRMTPVRGAAHVLLMVVAHAYAAVFIAAWNHDFPTAVELACWRGGSIMVFLGFTCYQLFTKIGYEWWPAIREKLMNYPSYTRWRGKMEWRPRNGVESKVYDKLHYVVRKIRNNTYAEQEIMHVPVKTQVPLYIAGFAYCVGRSLIAVLDITELRLLPESAYKESRWTSFLPHM